jgi:hypothetical protein
MCGCRYVSLARMRLRQVPYASTKTTRSKEIPLGYVRCFSDRQEFKAEMNIHFPGPDNLSSVGINR